MNGPFPAGPPAPDGWEDGGQGDPADRPPGAAKAGKMAGHAPVIRGLKIHAIWGETARGYGVFLCF